MKTLTQKEWIAVVISVFVVGFFFVFGQTLISVFSGNSQAASVSTSQTSRLQVNDTLMGSGALAQTGDLVVVHYTGMFTDGTVFDSSISRNEPYQFQLGSQQVIQGWNEGIAGMREGGKRIIIVPPELGYGFSDYGPIPGNSTLIFEVELLKVN